MAATLASATTGCESFLDINDNPNQQTSVTPDAQLATALVTTAANYNGNLGENNYNSYSSFAVGYWGKSGTVSGFSSEQTYNYTTNYYSGLFNTTYDNLNDYNLIQQNGSANGYPNHAAIARIMKVYNYLLLVDQYGDVPYTNALQGIGNTTPTYDKAEDIYKDLVVQLKGAVADINAAAATGRKVSSEDVVFGGVMSRWKQFANSLRLRILLRESQVPSLKDYVKSEMATLQTQSAADGFITTDVVVQPNYSTNAGQQNPFFTRYGYAPGAINPTSEYSFVMPTNYIIRQYESNKDPRITQLYTVGKRTVDGKAVPQYVGTDLGETSPPRFVATDATVGSRFLVSNANNPAGGTFLRGANAPTVLMLLAEHKFSKAEAETRGLFTGGEAAAKVDYLDGIKASFLQTYRLGNAAPTTLEANPASTPQVPSTNPVVLAYEKYIADNVGNPLVDYDAAISAGAELGKQSVIIYQKYLAENTVASTEAWDDYRRTALPKFTVSSRSASPRPDKLPTRLLYPQTEVSTNQGNIPTGTTQFTKIFWDVVD